MYILLLHLGRHESHFCRRQARDSQEVTICAVPAFNIFILTHVIIDGDEMRPLFQDQKKTEDTQSRFC